MAGKGISLSLLSLDPLQALEQPLPHLSRVDRTLADIGQVGPLRFEPRCHGIAAIRIEKMRHGPDLTRRGAKREGYCPVRNATILQACRFAAYSALIAPRSYRSSKGRAAAGSRCAKAATLALSDRTKGAGPRPSRSCRGKTGPDGAKGTASGSTPSVLLSLSSLLSQRIVANVTPVPSVLRRSRLLLGSG